MGVLAKYVKQPAERKRYQITYVNWLDTGEFVSNVVFTIDKVTIPPLVVDGVQVTPDNLGVQYYISGGVNGQAYVITATLNTNTGPQVRLDEVYVSVRTQP